MRRLLIIPIAVLSLLVLSPASAGTPTASTSNTTATTQAPPPAPLDTFPKNGPPTTTTTVPPTTTTTHTHEQIVEEPVVQEPTVEPVSNGGGAGDPNDPASWERLAGCETGDTYNWAINTGNGYYGGLQFSLGSWQGVGGVGYPHEASKATQIEMGKRLYAQGGWSHWPGCARRFGWL